MSKLTLYHNLAISQKGPPMHRELYLVNLHPRCFSRLTAVKDIGQLGTPEFGDSQLLPVYSAAKFMSNTGLP